MTIRRTEEVPGGFEGRAGGSKGNPTPTAKSTALYRFREDYRHNLWQILCEDCFTKVICDENFQTWKEVHS
jgi:hypothetical protein